MKMSKKNKREYWIGHPRWYWSRDGIYFEGGSGKTPTSAMIYVRRSLHTLKEIERPRSVYLIHGTYVHLDLVECVDEMLSRLISTSDLFKSHDGKTIFRAALLEEAKRFQRERCVNGSYVKFFENTKHEERIDWSIKDYVRPEGISFYEAVEE